MSHTSDTVSTSYVRARAAWPALDVPAEAFTAHLAACGQADNACVEDLYFALACIRRVPGAVELLHADHLADASAVVARNYRDPTLVEDVRQRVAAMLLVAEGDAPCALATYTGRGSLRSWLRVIALREASRITSKRREEPTDADTLFERALAGDDHELLRRKEVYRQLFRRAFDTAVRALSVHDRLLIRQHFCDGLTLDEMANLHRVHRATAARQLAKIRDKLFEQTRAVFEAELSVDPREFAELMQLIASQLDASISRLLG